MFQPGAQGLILIAMVMAIARLAILQGTFSLALADHMESTIPWYATFIYLEYCWPPKK